SMLWTGPAEAGDTRFFVSRGYVHVIGNPRGIGKSESGGSRAFDSYDLIEWIAAQPWCDGNVGMVGISGFGAEQFIASKPTPPHLKAIFPLDPRGAYGEAGGFRDEYPGGVIHLFRFLLQVYASAHQQKGQPKPLPPEREKLWQEAIANPDFKMYPHVYNVLALKGQHFPAYFDILIDPYDKEAAVEKSEAEFSKITVPTYTGAGWYGYTYKTHLNGAQNWFRNLTAPHKKLLLAGPAHLDRPIKAFHNEMLRWYDQWLKGIDSGILNDPPVRFWVMGANEWRSASDWPPPETQWIKFYLRGWERLTTEAFPPSSADDYQAPDAFAQMPASQTNRIQKLRYLSEPLPDDVTIAGLSVLHLYASIDRTTPIGSSFSRTSARTWACRPRAKASATSRRACTNGNSRAAGSRRPTAPSIRRDRCSVGRGTRSRAQRASPSLPARSTNTLSRSWRPPTSSSKVTASASRSPASTSRPASAAPPTSSTSPITSAAARPCCTGSITTPSIHRISCCRSLRTPEVRTTLRGVTPCPRSRFTTPTRWASRWANIRRSRASRRPSSCSSPARWRPTVAARPSARTTSMRSADRSSPTSKRR